MNKIKGRISMSILEEGEAQMKAHIFISRSCINMRAQSSEGWSGQEK
jgi:hypothetical protein